MFKYLKILSWFLFCFGVVLAAASLFGVELGIGNRSETLGLLMMQVAAASCVLYGFTLHKAGKLSYSVLLYGGWALIVLMIVTGQIWLNRGAT